MLDPQVAAAASLFPLSTSSSELDLERDCANMLKLLKVEPDHLENLIRTTGWSPDRTQQALLQLIARGAVKCVSQEGRRLYEARAQADATSHSCQSGKGAIS